MRNIKIKSEIKKYFQMVIKETLNSYSKEYNINIDDKELLFICIYDVEFKNNNIIHLSKMNNLDEFYNIYLSLCTNGVLWMNICIYGEYQDKMIIEYRNGTGNKKYGEIITQISISYQLNEYQVLK